MRSAFPMLARFVAALTLACGSAVNAESVLMTGQFPAKFREPSQLRKLSIAPFEGRAGGMATQALEAAFSSDAYFAVMSGPGGRRGAEGTLSGRAAASASQESEQHQETRCARGNLFKCKEKEQVTVTCTTRTIQVIVDARIERAADRQVIYSATKPYQDQSRFCEGQEPGTAPDQVIAALVGAAARDIKQDISPYSQEYKIRLEESTDGLTKAAVKPFRAAVKVSVKDLASSCQQWAQLRAGGEAAASLWFALGVCAEKAGDFSGAGANYASALGLAPGNKNIAEASARVRTLAAAQQAMAAQRAAREQTEAAERKAEADRQRAAEAAALSGKRKVAQRAAADKREASQRAAAAASERARQRQDVAAKYGADAADAILSRSVRKGMTMPQVRAALGEPANIKRIATGEEQWIYPGKRVVFLNGRVSFVG